MELQELLPKMTKLYLSRTVDSFLKDVKLHDEEDMRNIILKNIDEFKNDKRVIRNLNFRRADRDVTLINRLILKCLLGTKNYIASEEEIHKSVLELESQILEDSKDENYIKARIDETANRIYSAVLKTAWHKDDSLNEHEINILYTLRDEFQLSIRDHYLLESRIDRFPRKGGKLHTNNYIDKSLRDLQQRGIIVRIKSDSPYYVIPSDIARVVRYEMGEELRNATYSHLLNDLNVNQLRSILASINLNTGGVKETVVQRIIKHNILPSHALDRLSSSELTQFLRSKEGAKISGTKEEKIQSIIDYYENITTVVDSDPTDERSIYYDFFIELASRNYKSLRTNKVIDKDINVEKYFEEATRYLFEKKLELKLEELPGSKRADGKIKFDSKSVMLWDNKSTEKPYTFPDAHFQQFLNYIREEKMKVSVFLIIAHEFTNEAVNQAQKLKVFSEQDTGVALIKSEDLKYIAENWKNFSKQKEPKFDLQTFNLTAEMNRKLLLDRMEWIIN